MVTNQVVRRLGLLAGAAALLALSGCHVDANKSNGNEKVNISTPFGGMSVKTNEDAVQQGTGMAVYPGATLLSKEHGDDGAADVNMSFGSFHLGVKALSYKTQDNPVKVVAFYRKDMSKFGTVIECNGDHPVGTPDVTQDGLTCADNGNGHPKVHIDEDSGHEHLKAGSKLHQHIVSVEQQDGYTKIGMIALDLPGKFIDGNSSSQ